MKISGWPKYCGACILSEVYVFKTKQTNIYAYSLSDVFSRSVEVSFIYYYSRKEFLYRLKRFVHSDYGRFSRKIVIYFQETNYNLRSYKDFYNSLFEGMKVSFLEEHENPNTINNVSLLKIEISRKDLLNEISKLNSLKDKYEARI